MKMIVSAGGTGGHIYPALAIINKFREHEKDLEVLYIGTHNRMEKDIIPAKGIRYEALEIYGFSKKDILRDIKNIVLIIKAKRKVKRLIEEFKPDIVIGAGGYVTYPVISVASKMGIKTFIHEQNSIPGKSNLALASKCSLIGVSFEDSIKYFNNKQNVFYSGNPCGENAIEIKPVSKEELGFTKGKKLVVFVSGSLGSSAINKRVKDYLVNFKDDYEVLYVTGKTLYEEFIKDTKFPKNVKVIPFYDNLAALFRSADLVVTRAGASTISELLALNIPAIYIPSPYVANNHQYYNALSIKESNSGEMIEEKDLNSDVIREKILEILTDKDKIMIMKDNIKKLAMTDSSEIIYNKIKEII